MEFKPGDRIEVKFKKFSELQTGVVLEVDTWHNGKVYIRVMWHNRYVTGSHKKFRDTWIKADRARHTEKILSKYKKTN